MDAVVIATYNEAENAPAMARVLRELYPGLLLLFVDDDSPDGTAACLEALGDPDLVVLKRRGERGYGTAVRDGLIDAVKRGAKQVATMDCDFSHDPAALGELFAALNRADLVVGSRYVGGVRVMNWQMNRLLLSAFANWYVRTILRFPTEDNTSGYRAYRASLLRQMNLKTVRSNGYSFLVEMLFRAQRRSARITEVPIVFVERRVGESKMSKTIIVESAFLPWRLLFSKR